jgi:transposase
LIRPSRLSSRTDRGLKTAPTPARAARLTRTQIQAALKRAGRQRGIEPEADRLREVFRAEWAHQPPLIEDALGEQMLALLFQLDAACTAADQLAEAVEEAFPQHPDAEILLSFPGLGIQLAARVLAEIGDDRTRFADARGLKAYAGSSPITRASSNYRRRREQGDWHAAAQRNHRMIGQLYHCLNRARPTMSRSPSGPLPQRPLSLRLETVSGE